MNKITVTVTGKSGVGKSAIAQSIVEHLSDYVGFDTTLEFINHEHEPRTDKDLAFIIEEMILNNTEIEVIECLK